MWGDWHTDNPNTLTQAQKDKLINQAKMIAGITAAYAGEDVNVAAGVAAEAVENNSLRAVVQTVKIAGKLVQVVVKNGKVTIRDLKTILNKEKLDIIQDFRTITDGQLNLEDAQAVINLLIGIKFKNENNTNKIQSILKNRHSPLPFPNAVTSQNNGLSYKSNQKHTLGQPGNRTNAGIEPENSFKLFGNSVSGGDKRYAIDSNGNIHQFANSNDGTWHWAGRTGKDQPESQRLNSSNIPNNVFGKLGTTYNKVKRK